jgi:hypothetical protein
MAAIRLHHDVEGLGSTDTDPETHTLVAAGLVADFTDPRPRWPGPRHRLDAHGQAALAWLQVSSDDLVDWRRRCTRCWTRPERDPTAARVRRSHP